MIVTNMSLPFISGRIARRFDIPHIVHSLWLENSAQAGRVLPWGRYEILFTDEVRRYQSAILHTTRLTDIST